MLKTSLVPLSWLLGAPWSTRGNNACRLKGMLDTIPGLCRIPLGGCLGALWGALGSGIGHSLNTCLRDAKGGTQDGARDTQEERTTHK